VSVVEATAATAETTLDTGICILLSSFLVAYLQLFTNNTSLSIQRMGLLLNSYPRCWNFVRWLAGV